MTCNHKEYRLFISAFYYLCIFGLFFWKGFALWRSATSDQKNWFIAFVILLGLNTAGILELIYLFRFAKKRLTLEEVKGWKKYIPGRSTTSHK